jgi:hypothetical protein
MGKNLTEVHCQYSVKSTVKKVQVIGLKMDSNVECRWKSRKRTRKMTEISLFTKAIHENRYSYADTMRTTPLSAIHPEFIYLSTHL